MVRKWQDAKFYFTDEDIKMHYYSTQENCLYILGNGFDPRMLVGLKMITECVKSLDVLLVNFSDNDINAPMVQQKLSTTNRDELELLSKNYENIDISNVDNLSLYLKENLCIGNRYSRVIVDISSMPQSIYFHMVKHFVNLTKKQSAVKLDIIVCENSDFDDAIIPTDLQDANYLGGFGTFSNSVISDDEKVSIWFPLLGKNSGEVFLKFLNLTEQHDEICPILPFPSKNPRRLDEIFLELGSRLFGENLIDKRDILYVAERNVMDVYKKLHDAISFYNDVISLIGTPRFYVLADSSKLICLGALMVYLDLSASGQGTLSFANVNNGGYILDMKSYDNSQNQLCLLCMGDSIYEW